MTPPPVFVLGMHRSGTSAIAGALHELGYSFGRELLEAQAGVNDRGFFEDKRVLALHEAIFDSWGRDWRAPLLPPDDWLERAAAAGFSSQVDALVEMFSMDGLWGVKDPRLCFLFPLWRDAVERRDGDPRVILMLRDPAAVAASLLARDELHAAIGHTLWMLHMLRAERNTRGLQRLVVPYDTLIDQPHETLTTVASWLACAPAAGLMEHAETFLTPGLRRHDDEHDPAEFPLLADVWRLVSQGNLEDPETRRELDALHERLTASQALLGPALEWQNRRINEWEGDFAEAERQRHTVSSLLSEQQAGLAEATRQLEQARAASQVYQNAIRAQEDGFTQAVAMLQVRDDELLATRQALADLKAEAATQAAREAAGASAAEDLPDLAVSSEASVYRGVVDLRVDNNSHSRVVRYIRDHGTPAGGAILDVGCSYGYFGEALRHLGYEVWGIELNSVAVAEAEKRLDRAYPGSVESFLKDPAVADMRFQFVVFGDVVEHLVDPLAALRNCQALLADGGAVIVSIPNVAHKSIRLMLLEGRWDYDEVGILDRTHLHFYTRDSLTDLLDEAGYRIERFSAITVNTEDAGITVTPRIEDLFAQVIHDREQEAFQFVVMATPEPDAELRAAANARFCLRGHHRVLCLPPLKDSSLFSIRLGDPLTRMTEMYGGEFRLCEPHEVSEDDVTWADTVVFQRESNAMLLEMLRRFRKAGKRVIYDIDDLLVDVPEYLSVAKHCREVKPWLEAALREADAVSASTSELREALLEYNPHVYITPNYAWTVQEPIKHFASSDPVRIFVASSDSVRVDFLVDSLRAVIRHPDTNVELIGIGPPGEFLRDQGLEIEAHPTMNHEQFKALIAGQHNALALIPLDDNRFNRCKSAIKFFDYALAGVPAICSAVVPYHQVIDDPTNGILCLDDQEAWTRAILTLVLNPGQRQAIADTARRRCLEMHNLDRTAASWEELLLVTAFPQGDPVYGEVSVNARTPAQLLRGTLRHLARGASYRALWQACREGNFRQLWAKLKTVF